MAMTVGLAQTTDSRRLGTNLDAVTDYSPQLPFVDLFRVSRQWLTQCRAGVDAGCSSGNAFDTGESDSIDLDTHGWVRSLPAPSSPLVFSSVATFWDLPSEFPAGRYVVLYEGRGTIEYDLGAQKIPTRSQVGRDVVEVDIARGGVLLRIVETDPANYIRNIRFVAESDESRQSDTFSPRFLARLEPYQALRFMDWMRTNDSVVSTWSGRAKLLDARYSTAKGVPVEVMVDLANQTTKAPWFTIPHQVTDDYVTKFATVVRDTLSESLPVYVEYSNEIWNGGFSQGSWVQNRGEAEWPASTESGFTKRINWYGKRSAEVCDIFRVVFGGQAGRVQCVIASQAANSWTASEALACPLWVGNPCAAHGIKALAIAPYFGDYLGQEDSASTVTAWTRGSDGGLSRLYREVQSGGELSGGPQGGALAQSFEWIEANRAVAHLFGISLVAYEGGQHLVGVGAASTNSSMTELFTSANRHTRMGEVYGSYLSGWEARGGELFMHFTDIGAYSRYGSWGALEKVGETTSPKFSALYRYSLGSLPPSASESLRVKRRGRGGVVSAPAGIQCGATCSTTFEKRTRVTLTATPARGWRFVSWSGACQGVRRRCAVTLSKGRSVTALFTRSRL